MANQLTESSEWKESIEGQDVVLSRRRRGGYGPVVGNGLLVLLVGLALALAAPRTGVAGLAVVGMVLSYVGFRCTEPSPTW